MFRGKTAIITGGSSGIGRELARRLAAAGSSLALVARDMDKLGAARDELTAGIAPAAGQRVEVFSCEVSDAARVAETVERIVAALGPPDFLFNSAGVLSGGYFEELPLEDFRRLMEVNFFGTLNFTRAALPHLKKRPGARIVNIGSVAGAMGVFGYTSYCASKYAVAGLTESLRMELKPQGIRVHLVMPPETETPMLERIQGVRTFENRKIAELMPPLSAEATVNAVLRGMERGRFLIIPGLRAGLMIRLGRIMPGISAWITDSVVKRNYRGPGSGR
jgi:3-dehydrosphinganine reductase